MTHEIMSVGRTSSTVQPSGPPQISSILFVISMPLPISFLHIPPTSLSYRSMDRTPVAAPLQAGTKKPPSRRLQSRWLRVSFEEIPAFSKPDRETREIPDDADACSDGRQKFQHRTESSDCRSHITDFTGIGHFGNLALISARLSRQVPAETSPACSSQNSVSASS